jgi:hypothetical protein
MRALLISLATTAGATAALLYGCDRLENPQRKYVALTDEVFLGGWVPRLLPPSAIDIRTQHNIDTTEVWVRFKVGTTSFSPAEFGFRRVEPSVWPTQVRQPRHANWWFKSLSEFSARDATLYRGTCQDASAGAPARSGHMLVVAGDVYLWCGGAGAA